MTERQVKAGLKNWHRWLGAGAALFLVLSAGTGFLLQHPSWLGSGEGPPAALAVDPGDPDRLLRGTRWGVEESRDEGATWHELPMLAPPENVHRILFADPAGLRVFALGPEALITASDGGRIWNEIRFPVELLPPGSRLIDVAGSDQGPWLVLSDTGVLVSNDQGATWSRFGPAPAPAGIDWRQRVHDLHTGHILGTTGRRVAELTALAAVFLTLSGLVMLSRRNGRRPR